MTEMNCGHDGAVITFIYKHRDGEVTLLLCGACFWYFMFQFLDGYNQLNKEQKKELHEVGKFWRRNEP